MTEQLAIEQKWWRETQGYQRSSDVPNEEGPSYRLYYPEPRGFKFFRAVRFKSPSQRTLFNLSAMPLVCLHSVFSPESRITGSGVTIRDIPSRQIICYKGEKDKRGKVVANSALSYKCDVTLEDYCASRIVSAYFNSGGIVAVVLNDGLLGEDESLYGKIDPDKTDYENEGLVSLFKRATIKALEKSVQPASFEDVQAVVRKLGPKFAAAFRAILD